LTAGSITIGTGIASIPAIRASDKFRLTGVMPHNAQARIADRG
jgi:hypothetical protein